MLSKGSRGCGRGGVLPGEAAIRDLGFDWGLGLGVWGLEFGVWGLGFRVQGLGFSAFYLKKQRFDFRV